MKAVLLAAGVGQRLRPITNSIPKQMISIGGKPLLEYIINDITSLGFDKICIVIGHHGNQIKNYFGEGRRFNATIEYVTQQEYKGTADATNYARKFVGKDKFLLYLSDTIIPKRLHEHVQYMLTEDSEANILSAKVSLEKMVRAG
ncbi:MAG: sugar phosphate nucleotidyltransferase, partial [Nitrosopumilaceae archaeon]